MAIFHLNARTGTRAPARGSTTAREQSAAAHCSYLARLGRYKDAGEDEVLHLESGHMPTWSTTYLAGKCHAAALNYWKAADQFERVNGRLFKSVEFALPAELNLKQQVELTCDFVNQITTTKDGALPFTFAIHKGKGDNPHCHVLISERVHDGRERTPEIWFKRAATGSTQVDGGGAKKTRELKSKEWLSLIRQRWAELANAALQNFGFGARIDHRSHAARGIAEAPGEHRGVNATAIERRTGRRSRRGHDQSVQRLNHAHLISNAREIGKVEAQITDLKTRARYRPPEDISIFSDVNQFNQKENDDFEQNDFGR